MHYETSEKNHLNLKASVVWKTGICGIVGVTCQDVKSSLALRQRDANELVKTDTICEDMQMHREGITNTPES